MHGQPPRRPWVLGSTVVRAKGPQKPGRHCDHGPCPARSLLALLALALLSTIVAGQETITRASPGVERRLSKGGSMSMSMSMSKDGSMSMSMAKGKGKGSKSAAPSFAPSFAPSGAPVESKGKGKGSKSMSMSMTKGKGKGGSMSMSMSMSSKSMSRRL